MFLRKRWVAKLAEWLFGSSVAAACLAPIVASPSITAGEIYLCWTAQMCPCVDSSTGAPCSNPSGDGSQPHMFHTCTALAGDLGALSGTYFTCAAGCQSSCYGFEGRNCAVNKANCYY
jgi:hypothetical protein